MLQAEASTPETSSVATSSALTSSTTSTASTTSSTDMAPRKGSSSKQATKQPWVRGLLEDSAAHKKTRIDLIVEAIKAGKAEIAGSNSYVGYYGNMVVSMVGRGLNLTSLKNAAGTPLAEYIATINPFDWNQATRIDERENVTAYSWMVSYAMNTLSNINDLEATTAEEIEDLKRSTAQKVKELEEQRDAKVKELENEKTRVVSELQTKLSKDEAVKKEAKSRDLNRLDREKREGIAELERQSTELLKVHGKTLEVLEKSKIEAQLNTAQAVRANERAIEVLKKNKEAEKTAVKDKFKEEFATLQAKGSSDIEDVQVKADHTIEDIKIKTTRDIAAARLHEKTTIEAKTQKQTQEVQAGFAAINACMGYLDTIMLNMKIEEIEPNHEVTNQLFNWIVEATQKREDKYAEQLRDSAVILQKTMIQCGVEQDSAAARKLTKLVSKSKSTERKRGSFSSPSPRSSVATTTTSITTDTSSDLAPIELSINVSSTASSSSSDANSLQSAVLPPPVTSDHLAPYSDTVLSPAARHTNVASEEVAPATLTVAQSSGLAFGGAEDLQANKDAPSPKAVGATITVITSSNEAGVLIAPEPSPTLPRSNSLNKVSEAAVQENAEMQSPRGRAPSLTAASLEQPQPVREASASTEGREDSPPLAMSLESLHSNDSEEPVSSPKAGATTPKAESMEVDEPAKPSVAANDDKKPLTILAPQRRAVTSAPQVEVTMHVAPAEAKQEGKGNTDQAKLVKVATTLQFKYAGDSKSHANMGVLADQGYDPSVMKKDQYPIEAALIHLSSSSLTTPSLYKYMMYSIEKIDALKSAKKISVESLNKIVSDHRGYDSTLKQNWVKYVENKGTLPEMSLAS